MTRQRCGLLPNNVGHLFVIYRRPQRLLSKTYVKKSEAGRLTAEILGSSRAMIDVKLADWNTMVTQQTESRDQVEEDSELRQSFDDLRHELQVTTIHSSAVVSRFLSIRNIFGSFAMTHSHHDAKIHNIRLIDFFRLCAAVAL